MARFVELLAAATLLALVSSPVPVRADETVGIVVRLSDPPVTRYTGGTARLAATSAGATGRRFDARSPAVASYRAHLAARQDEFVRAVRAVAPAAKLLHRYQMVLGGLALRVPADTVDAIAALPGVVAVHRDRLEQPATDKSPVFIGAKPVWKELGGQETAGEGVIVGVLDTGVWPEHPSFSDPDPAGNPYPPPAVPHQCQMDLGDNPGPDFACNRKLIGAYRFLAAYDACVGAGQCTNPPGTFTSTRDDEGHGTHTATTAAGNGQVQATLLGFERGAVSGIAPRAQVIAYKVCGQDGCLLSDSVAAVDQAIFDGVDVINFSIGGGSAPYSDPVELAFLDAFAAGIFVAASAGNSGPAAETVSHRGPWVMTVAASSQKRQFASTLTLTSSDGTKLKVEGATVTAGIGAPLPVVDAGSVGDPGCLLGPADGAFLGKVVLCQRGPGRLQRTYNAAQRGAAGVILYNPALLGRATDNHTIPTINLEVDASIAMVTFMGLHPGVVATFTPGKAKGGAADRMAPFSSRGGPLQPLGTSKPDITAPGMQILAGNTPDSTTPTDADDQLFQAIQGTSMSSPHVAGAAALVRALHPGFTPGQIKSVLMTLASAKRLYDEDGTTPFDPFDAGSGRLAIKKAADVAITFDAAPTDFLLNATHLWDVNAPSLFVPNVASTVSVMRTARSVLAVEKTLKLKVEAPADLVVSVPPAITIPAGSDATFPIDVDVSAVPEGAVRHAAIIFTGGGPKLRFPITVRKMTGTTTLYAGNGGGTTPVPGGIVVLDQAVGSGTLLGDPVTPGWLSGIAFTSTGLLYATTNEGGPSRLLRIDPNTGALAASIGTITNGLGGAVSIADLTVQPGTDVLFGIRWNGDGAGLAGWLYTIDPVTAVATTVGNTGTCNEGGLGFAPNGTLYFAGAAGCSSGRALHVLNPATGGIVSSIPLGGFYESLGVRPTDGALFASAGSGSLYVIDPATGAEAYWGETGTGVVADLAFR